MAQTVFARRRAVGLAGLLLLAGSPAAWAQFNDIQSFDGTANTFFGVTNPVPYWSVVDGCSPGLIFLDGTRGDNGTSCLRSLLPVSVGTRMVRDLNPGSGSSTFGDMRVTGIDVIWRLWVSADDGSGSSGQELYRVLSPLYGVMTLTNDINAGPAGSVPSNFYHHNPGVAGRVYFSADNGSNGREPWMSNTSAGLTVTTAMLADVNPGGNSDPTGFTGTGYTVAGAGTHVVVFAADNGADGRELWKSDGTGANTQLLMNINQSAPAASSDPQQFTQVIYSSAAATLDIRAFFTADNGVNGRELWCTNGTLGGTGMCKDIVAGAAGSNPANLVAGVALISGSPTNVLYFTVDSDGANGEELWRSRGAFDGSDTLQVYDPAAAGSPAKLTSVAGLNLVFFTLGNELWKSNGTAAGTVLVKAFAAGPQNLISAGSGTGAALFFSADDGTGSGVELWKATASAVTLVKDIRTGPESSSPQNLYAMGGTVYCSADDGVNGRELWRTDNTAGALLVKDINPGAASSNPARLFNFDGTVVFTADDGTHGVELWQTDGFAVPNNSGMSYKWDLAANIQAKSGNPAKVAVGATDGAPLSIFWLHDFPAMGGPTANISEAAHQINMYVELTDGIDRVPFAVSPVDCGDGNLPRPRAALTDGTTHNAIAFGMVAALDPDPCDTNPRGGGSPSVPFAHVPAVFDGERWIPMSIAEFTPGVPTAPPTSRVIGQAPSNAYLHTGLPAGLVAATDDPWAIRRFGWGRIDVWSDSITVVWGARQSSLTWVATLPRKYLGGFKSLYLGNRACLQPGYPFYTDTLHLTGGLFMDSTEPFGACCAKAGCSEVPSAAECANGTFTAWRHCDDAGYLCCPIPWADHDRDGDVDSGDFGLLQRCMTGDQTGVAAECVCFDHNKDNKLNQVDLEAFIDCGTGPGIATDPVPPGCGP